jgi:drug/metabolite transporter (DMT)-like permease
MTRIADSAKGSRVPAARRHRPSTVATIVLCVLALVGFAANSLIARGALGAHAIDAATYTLLRLGSGVVMLAALVAVARDTRRGAGAAGASPLPVTPSARVRWTAATALALYAAAFSYSYLRIGAALGALVLFPTVKAALLAEGHRRGEHPPVAEWIGATLGLASLAVLTAPGAGRPDAAGVALMAVAGLAWAAYTVAGKRVTDPLRSTRDNFARASLVASPLLVAMAASGHATPRGLLLAGVSGAITSALPYVIWYQVVPRLTGMQLGLAQLSVPVLAGLGAVALLGETLTVRLLAAAALIAGGVLVAVAPKAQR